MKPICITMDMPPPELRGNSRANRWTKNREFQNYRDNAYFRLCIALSDTGSTVNEVVQVEKVRIKFTFYYCGNEIDSDNFEAGMKAFRDALRPTKMSNPTRRHPLGRPLWGIGIIPDDSHSHIILEPSECVRVPHRDEVRVGIEITEVDTDGVV